MKIAQLCPYAMERHGGVQRHVRDLAAWLTEAGHRTRIIAPPLPGQRPRRDGHLHEIGWSRGLAVHGTRFEVSVAAPRRLRELATDLRDWGVDLLHLHTPWTPFLVGQVAAALPEIPRVTTVHATLPDPSAKTLVDRYIRWSARRQLCRSVALVVPSQAPVSMLKTLDPACAPIEIAPAIDLSALTPGEASGKHLLYLGRLEPRKGVDVLLSAWPRIKAACPNAKLTIAGDGALMPLIQAAEDVTHFGAPSDTEARRLLAAADIVLAPAPYGESYGLILAEAMAAGAVPLAAANAGFAAVLDGAPECLVPPGDAPALADRAIQLLRDDPLRARLRAWGQSAALKSDVRSAGPQFLRLYERVLNVPP